MKGILILLCFILPIQVYSQSTTEEEYNYITKGYKTQADQGLDIKKGYSLKNYGKWLLSFGNKSKGATFKGFYRDGDPKPCAIMAIYQELNKDSVPTVTEYYCIPVKSGEALWGNLIDQVNAKYGKSNGEDIYEAMLYAFMHFSSDLVAK
ncbi:MAG TPA: hypothetical protein VK806_05985 [Bacteroidia bacterium]|jgi:hypothetical protein|nr:hypothetical protein [Bacteroidia bacterium]